MAKQVIVHLQPVHSTTQASDDIQKRLGEVTAKVKPVIELWQQLDFFCCPTLRPLESVCVEAVPAFNRVGSSVL
jgi:hypothetical protein